jgi:GntR family transcriptional regulator
MVNPQSDNGQDRPEYTRQMWIGLACIFLLIVVPPMCGDVQMLVSLTKRKLTESKKGVDKIELMIYNTIVLLQYNNRMDTTMNFYIDPASGVPFYRQIIDQIKYAIARSELRQGDQLPTVRQLAVDLAINPNTVGKAYSQLEILGILQTQQGSGTFISPQKVEVSELERQGKLDTLCREFISSAASYGFTLNELIEALHDRKENS